MGIKIIISDIVGFKVKGAINDAAGVAQPFDFSLTCTRLDADQLHAKIKDDSTLVEFLADVVQGWSGVRDADDKPLPYTEDALRQLCKIPGVAGVAYRTYCEEVGAKTKN